MYAYANIYVYIHTYILTCIRTRVSIRLEKGRLSIGLGKLWLVFKISNYYPRQKIASPKSPAFFRAFAPQFFQLADIYIYISP